MQDMRILFLAKLFGQMVKFANAGVAAAADLGAGASVGNSIPVLSGTHKCGSNGDYADSDISAKSGGQCVERDSGAGTGNPRAEAGTDANTDVRASASDANAFDGVRSQDECGKAQHYDGEQELEVGVEHFLRHFGC